MNNKFVDFKCLVLSFSFPSFFALRCTLTEVHSHIFGKLHYQLQHVNYLIKGWCIEFEVINEEEMSYVFGSVGFSNPISFIYTYSEEMTVHSQIIQMILNSKYHLAVYS